MDAAIQTTVSGSFEGLRVPPRRPAREKSAPIIDPWEQPGIGSKYEHFASNVWYRKVNEELLDFAPPAPGSTAIDLGSGTGAGSSALFNAMRGRGQVIGIDKSAQLVEFADLHAARPGLRFIQGDVHELNTLVPGLVDSIYAFNALHLFPSIKLLLSECQQKLNPGGQLAFCTGYTQEALDRDSSRPWVKLFKAVRDAAAEEFPDLPLGPRHTNHCESRAWRCSDIEQMLRQAGFESISKKLVPVQLDLESILQFARMPGMGSAVLPLFIDPEARERIMICAARSAGFESYMRNWALFSAKKCS